MSAPARLRQLLARAAAAKSVVLLPCAYDGLTARVIQRAGFEAAFMTGFGVAAVMRHHFVKVLQTTPTAYRRTFGARRAG